MPLSVFLPWESISFRTSEDNENIKAMRSRMAGALPVYVRSWKKRYLRTGVGAAAGFFVAFVSALAGVKS